MRRPLMVVTLLVAIVTAAAAARAAYPDRPVKLIVPWAAGGDTDAIFRPFGQQLQKHLGQTVVIANVTGASGTAGAREAKGSPPDGYTLYAVHDYIHSTYYTGVADVAYTDFEPICSVSNTPSVLTASPKTKWSSWQELAADAKARPGQITFGATLGSTSHFFPALIEKASGVKFKYVSYEGLAPRMNAILGGHIDLTDSNLTQKGKVDAGQLKFLAVATDKRLADAPNVHGRGKGSHDSRAASSILTSSRGSRRMRNSPFAGRCVTSIWPGSSSLRSRPSRSSASSTAPSLPSKVVNTGAPNATASRFIVPPAEITRSA